jgi:hypothetical protein
MEDERVTASKKKQMFSAIHLQIESERAAPLSGKPSFQITWTPQFYISRSAARAGWGAMGEAGLK